MIAFESCMYLLAGFAVLTGSLDLALGMKGQKNLGARLTDEGFADPLLNSQFRYLGTMWLGFGAALFLCLSDLPRYVVLFQGLMAMMFLGGLGRLASIFQFGIPMPRAGRRSSSGGSIRSWRRVEGVAPLPARKPVLVILPLI